jgi:hypothetical protein
MEIYMNNTSNDKPDKEVELQPNKPDGFELQRSSNLSSKKHGNKNALSHGVYSKDIVLPFESQSEFDALVDAFRDEWQPCGRSEEEAVFDLAYAAWLKRRIRKLPQIRFHERSERESSRSGDKPPNDQLQNVCKYAELKDQTELLTRLDAHNDKALRRLTSLKVFKRVEAEVTKPPRQIESPPMAPTDPTETEVPLKTVETET